MIRSPQETGEAVKVSEEHSEKSKQEYEKAMKETDASFTTPATPTSKSKVPNNYVTKNEASKPKLDESLFEGCDEEESLKPEEGEELTEGELGSSVGTMAGGMVGTAVGGPVGGAVGSAVGGFVGDKVGDKIGSTVDDKLGAGVSSSISSGLSGLSSSSTIDDDMNESYQYKIARERITKFNEGVTQFDTSSYLENLVKKGHLSLDEAISLKEYVKGDF